MRELISTNCYEISVGRLVYPLVYPLAQKIFALSSDWFAKQVESILFVINNKSIRS